MKRIFFAAVVLFLAASQGQAAEVSRIVVGFPPGQATHIIARLSTDPRADKALQVISQQVGVLSRLADVTLTLAWTAVAGELRSAVRARLYVRSDNDHHFSGRYTKTFSGCNRTFN